MIKVSLPTQCIPPEKPMQNRSRNQNHSDSSKERPMTNAPDKSAPANMDFSRPIR